MNRHPEFRVTEVTSPWRPVPRVARVEFPALSLDESVVFGSVEEAQENAQKWASEDEVLVLVWEFGAAMYVGRYDGRTGGFCDTCDKWADHLTTVDGDNPYRIRDECIFCRCNIPR
jgi:hypothetical protein